MAHTGFTVLRAPAASIEDAHEIVGRLTQAGFARNSIDVDRQGDNQFEVMLHVSQPNRSRAQQAIDNALGLDWHIGVPSTTVMLIVGGAAALGAGLLALGSMNALPKSLPWLHRAGSGHRKRDARHESQ
jgi:hypothetical protein